MHCQKRKNTKHTPKNIQCRNVELIELTGWFNSEKCKLENVREKMTPGKWDIIKYWFNTSL